MMISQIHECNMLRDTSKMVCIRIGKCKYNMAPDTIRAIKEFLCYFPNHNEYLAIDMYGFFSDIETTFPISESNMKLLSNRDNWIKMIPGIFHNIKSYIALVRTNFNGVLIQFDSLDFLKGICNFLMWTFNLDSLISLVSTADYQFHNIKFEIKDNYDGMLYQKSIIKKYLLEIDMIDVLINIVLDYIIGLCDNSNASRIIKCHNYHTNMLNVFDGRDTKLLCNNCIREVIDIEDVDII